MQLQNKLVFQAAAIAAVVASVCAVLLALAQVAALRMEPPLVLQPSLPGGPASEFMRASNDYPDRALRFFALDSLFVPSYLLVFAGLYAVARQRSGLFAALGLGAGILAAVLDAVENAYFINYALLAKSGAPLSDPALPLVYNLANLKWMAAFTALYALGLIWPRHGLLEWIISALMLLFPLVGVLGVAFPGLVALRGLFFLVGMPLFAWYLWKQTGAED